MASQQTYPAYGTSSTNQQSYPVPRPTSAAAEPLVTVVGGRDFIVEGRDVQDVPGVTSVGVV